MGNAMSTRGRLWKAAAVLAVAAMVGACSGSPQARSITLTFIRHAQSEANASGTLDTSVPGPGLSPAGREQAEQLGHTLAHYGYDGIYASVMVRTQQTAAPLAGELGKQVQVLPGLQEISAGWFNGEPMKQGLAPYQVAMNDWLAGDTTYAIPGSVSGTQFNEEFSRAVQRIYDSGQNKPAVFSHGQAIMMWTLLNARNARSTLFTSHPLANGSRVVVTGNPSTGWSLTDWDGIHDFGG
jgi:broad specificity phosphatase PhoE